MNIIGLGSAGCAIASLFSLMKEYKNVIKIDTANEENVNDKNYLTIEERGSPEEYEDIPKFKELLKLKGKTLFIVGGGGNASLASLSILQQIKDKCKINVLYIQPELDFLGVETKQKEKLVFKVFQEYARSGLFENLILASNSKIESILGGIPVIYYYEKINEILVSTLHTLFSLQGMKAVTNTISKAPIGTRIMTFGFVDSEDDEDKDFFELNNISDVFYYHAYNEDVLREDAKLFSSIKQKTKDKLNTYSRVSYGIFATNYENAIVLFTKHSSEIQ